MTNREQVRRDALDRDQLRARAEHGMSDIYDWDRHDRWPPDTCLALLTALEQAKRDLEGVHLALAEADVPRSDGVDEPLYSEQHRVRLLRQRAEQAERERDEWKARAIAGSHDAKNAYARLAAVPALVEAGSRLTEFVYGYLDQRNAGTQETRDTLAFVTAWHEALFAYEEAQEQR